LSGPGLGTGVLLDEVHHVQYYVVNGLAAGTYTWTIATSYQPGGILTPSSAWPTATATVSATPGPTGHYRLIALGFKATDPSNDDILAGDGKGDEVYFQAMIHTTTRPPGGPGTSPAVAKFVRTFTYGDVGTGSKFPGRVQTGSASPTGGIAKGDLVPTAVDFTAAPGTLFTNRFPLVVWEGVLDDDAVVVVHPTLWEEDTNPVVSANWVTRMIQEAQSGYYDASRTDNDTAGEIAKLIAESRIYDHSVRGSKLFACQNSLITVAYFVCRAHGTDRPLGLHTTYLYTDEEAGFWDEILVLTRGGVEAELASNNGHVSRDVRLGVVVNTVGFYETGAGEARADYTFYYRLERLP
jgi:hypothetical protein